MDSMTLEVLIQNLKEAEKNGELDPQSILDNLVHDAKAEEAAEINNQGWADQISYLIEKHSDRWVLDMLRQP